MFKSNLGKTLQRHCLGFVIGSAAGFSFSKIITGANLHAKTVDTNYLNWHEHEYELDPKSKMMVNKKDPRDRQPFIPNKPVEIGKNKFEILYDRQDLSLVLCNLEDEENKIILTAEFLKYLNAGQLLHCANVLDTFIGYSIVMKKLPLIRALKTAEPMREAIFEELVIRGLEGVGSDHPRVKFKE